MVDRVVVDSHGTAAGLRRIHRDVGMTQQLVTCCTVRWRERDTDAGVDADLDAVDVDRVQQLLLVVAKRLYGAAATDPKMTEHSTMCGERHGEVAVVALVVRGVLRDYVPVIANAVRPVVVDELELGGRSVQSLHGADHDLV